MPKKTTGLIQVGLVACGFIPLLAVCELLPLAEFVGNALVRFSGTLVGVVGDVNVLLARSAVGHSHPTPYTCGRYHLSLSKLARQHNQQLSSRPTASIDAITLSYIGGEKKGASPLQPVVNGVVVGHHARDGLVEFGLVLFHIEAVFTILRHCD